MKRIGVPFIIAAVCAVALATVSSTTAASAAVPIAGTFHPLDPARILDTRDGTGVTGSHVGPLGAAQVIAVDVTGAGGVPETGVGAVTLNLTITEAQGAGYATVWPCGTARPYASNVNFVRGVDLANQVTVKVGANGHVCLFSSVTTQIVGDVNGWWGDGFESAPGFHYESVDPARILDSRTGTGMPGGIARPIAAGETLPVTVAGVAGIALDAAAVSFNLTATNVDGPGMSRCSRVARRARTRRTSTSRRVSMSPTSSRAASGPTARCVSTALPRPIWSSTSRAISTHGRAHCVQYSHPSSRSVCSIPVMEPVSSTAASVRSEPARSSKCRSPA
jgi:hypothetical protein